MGGGRRDGAHGELTRLRLEQRKRLERQKELLGEELRITAQRVN